MGISLSDLDKWNPDAINAVFSAVTDHSQATSQTSHGLGQVMSSVPWKGTAYDAARAASTGIQRDLDLHAKQYDAVANAVKVAEAEIPIHLECSRLAAMWLWPDGKGDLNGYP